MSLNALNQETQPCHICGENIDPSIAKWDCEFNAFVCRECISHVVNAENALKKAKIPPSKPTF